MDDVFANPFWHALKSDQGSIAIGSAAALRYPSDVIPFAGLRDGSADAMNALCDLMTPGEEIHVTGDRTCVVPGLVMKRELPCLQMHFAPAALDRLTATEKGPIEQLTAVDANAMVKLTDIAFPGYFRQRTYTLGRYFGIRVDGELAAMAGERIALPGHREISAVCTHPAHVGKGYAAALIQHLLQVHADDGLRSFLHVLAANERAVRLYERLGFATTRMVLVHRLLRR